MLGAGSEPSIGVGVPPRLGMAGGNGRGSGDGCSGDGMAGVERGLQSEAISI